MTCKRESVYDGGSRPVNEKIVLPEKKQLPMEIQTLKKNVPTTNVQGRRSTKLNNSMFWCVQVLSGCLVKVMCLGPKLGLNDL